MIDVYSKDIANFSDNLDVFPNNVAVFRLGVVNGGAATSVKRELS